MTKDSLIVDLRNLRKEMRGISPKLSIYTKFVAREEELLRRIGTEVPDSILKNNKKSRYDRAISRVGAKNMAIFSANTSMKRPRCATAGCANWAKRGRKDKNGKLRFVKMCRDHFKTV